jgi:hypothetical protein
MEIKQRRPLCLVTKQKNKTKHSCFDIAGAWWNYRFASGFVRPKIEQLGTFQPSQSSETLYHIWKNYMEKNHGKQDQKIINTWFEHLSLDTDFDYRMSMILIDNSVELMIAYIWVF